MQTFLKTLERLKSIDNLIKLKATGSPNELADRLGICPSHLFNLLKLLKEFGAPLRFDVSANSYYYYTNFKLNLSFNNYLNKN